jgi:ubiquinone/menaquinone biosynthesis C-methylase UbiE
MDRQTIDTYNQMAREYDDETIGFWEQFPHTFLDTFIQLTGERVLDIGSGPGRDGLLLKQAGKHVTCLDASTEMINLSRARGLKSVLGDFTALPFGEASFNGVWAYTSLLHIPKKSIHEALREIHRVLSPAGIFALGLIEGDTEEYRKSSGVDLPRWFSFYQQKEVERIVQDCGFKLVHFTKFKPRSKNYLNFIFQKV